MSGERNITWYQTIETVYTYIYIYNIIYITSFEHLHFTVGAALNSHLEVPDPRVPDKIMLYKVMGLMIVS